jgi:hypothetical protein
MKIILALLMVASCALSVFGQAKAASKPFTLSLGVEGEFINGHEPTEGSHVVKAGSRIFIRITKTNTSNHKMGCGTVSNSMTALDPSYEYDVRRSTGDPASKHVINHMELGSRAFQGLGCEFKPGESSTSGGNEITRLYDLSQPGEYTIQVSQAGSDKPNAEVVKSNTITVTVTDDDSVIERATPPFRLRIDASSAGTAADHLVVKAGAEVGIDIVKTNTSKHEEDCIMIHNNMTGVDDKYQYDLRDRSGNPVDKRRIEHPEPFIIPPGSCTLKPGESQASGGNTITRLYDLSRPGEYAVQVSQPVSDNPKDGVVKSNTITITVTE